MMPLSFYICKEVINANQGESVFNFGKLVCFHTSEKWSFSSLLVYLCFPWKLSYKFEVCNFSFISSQTCTVVDGVLSAYLWNLISWFNELSEVSLKRCPESSRQLCPIICCCYLFHQRFTTHCLKTMISFRVEKNEVQLKRQLCWKINRAILLIRMGTIFACLMSTIYSLAVYTQWGKKAL